MQHKIRTWKITVVTSPSELAIQLTAYRHCLCQGFAIRRYLFLNDSELDQQANYAICVDERYCFTANDLPPLRAVRQIEARDFTYLNYLNAKDEVDAVLSGRYDFYHFETIDHQRLNDQPKRILCNQCNQA